VPFFLPTFVEGIVIPEGNIQRLIGMFAGSDKSVDDPFSNAPSYQFVLIDSEFHRGTDTFIALPINSNSKYNFEHY